MKRLHSEVRSWFRAESANHCAQTAFIYSLLNAVVNGGGVFAKFSSLSIVYARSSEGYLRLQMWYKRLSRKKRRPSSRIILKVREDCRKIGAWVFGEETLSFLVPLIKHDKNRLMLRRGVG